MRLNINPTFARIGGVEIHKAFRVVELDAGHSAKTGNHLSNGDPHSDESIFSFSASSLSVIEAQLAVVIPCMNEAQHLLDGILHGIPHECLIILVSNSHGDIFDTERTLLRQFCRTTQRTSIIVHQQDEGLASAFCFARLHDIVSDPEGSGGRIHNGKGEAMLIGAAIAKIAKKKFIGFIDADNVVPGAAHEYCKVYAAGLYLALRGIRENEEELSVDGNHSTEDPLAMVRIQWNSKPKIKDGGLVFEKHGRSSRVVNEWMNRLVSALADSSTTDGLIRTGNAGEHAMSVDLAMELRFATGYAVEPFQIVDILERSIMRSQAVEGVPNSSSPTGCIANVNGSGRRLMDALSSPLSQPVRILQVETRNPHIHNISKGDSHITRMQIQGLSTIYHSSLTPLQLKEELRQYMQGHFGTTIGAWNEPGRTRIYPPLGSMDWDVFQKYVIRLSETLEVIGSTSDAIFG